MWSPGKNDFCENKVHMDNLDWIREDSEQNITVGYMQKSVCQISKIYQFFFIFLLKLISWRNCNKHYWQYNRTNANEESLLSHVPWNRLQVFASSLLVNL